MRPADRFFGASNAMEEQLMFFYLPKVLQNTGNEDKTWIGSGVRTRKELMESSTEEEIKGESGP